jgi:hypothetical protein
VPLTTGPSPYYEALICDSSCDATVSAAVDLPEGELQSHCLESVEPCLETAPKYHNCWGDGYQPECPIEWDDDGGNGPPPNYCDTFEPEVMHCCEQMTRDDHRIIDFWSMCEDPTCVGWADEQCFFGCVDTDTNLVDDDTQVDERCQAYPECNGSISTCAEVDMYGLCDAFSDACPATCDKSGIEKSVCNPLRDYYFNDYPTAEYYDFMVWQHPDLPDCDGGTQCCMLVASVHWTSSPTETILRNGCADECRAGNSMALGLDEDVFEGMCSTSMACLDSSPYDSWECFEGIFFTHCESHSDCEDMGQMCYHGQCKACSNCNERCDDGIDGTCGKVCGSGICHDGRGSWHYGATCDTSLDSCGTHLMSLPLLL